MVNARLEGPLELGTREFEALREFAMAKPEVLRLLEVMKRSADRARTG